MNSIQTPGKVAEAKPWEVHTTFGDDFYESLHHNHRRYLWPDHPGTYLAHHKRTAPGHGPFLRSPHRCRRGPMRLGLCLVQAWIAVMIHVNPRPWSAGFIPLR